jgi:hypothetical protein
MSIGRIFGGVFVLATAVAVAPACNGSFPHIGPDKSLVMTLQTQPGVDPNVYYGTPSGPLPIIFDPDTAAASPFYVHIEAHNEDGSIDPTFNTYVRISSQPGTVSDLAQRDVKLVNGVLDMAPVSVIAAFGPTRLWVEDLGYVPGDPLAMPPPQCANGRDDNGNGLIDYPADPGCYSSVDDTEDGGSYDSGVSGTIWVAPPRIADVRGRLTNAKGDAYGGTATNFPNEQIQIFSGWNAPPQDDFVFSTIVTQIDANGFYATDLQDDITDPAKLGFSSVYAFNFSTPPNMRICDRLKTFGGTASDFHGYTEINYPTWLLEEWDPTQRPCMVPEPHDFLPGELQPLPTGVSLPTPNALFYYESALVRLQTTPGGLTVTIPKNFGPGTPMCTTTTNPSSGLTSTSCDFSPGASSCDLNGDGSVSFDVGDPEDNCSIACAESIDCSEYTQYVSENEFTLSVTAPGGAQYKIFANSSTSTTFSPTNLKGTTLRSFTGMLRYFSGGTQFTIASRCDDDIVTGPSSTNPTGAPLSSETACVNPRTGTDINEGTQ